MGPNGERHHSFLHQTFTRSLFCAGCSGTSGTNPIYERAVREGFLQEAVSEHPLEEGTRGRVAWRLAFRSGVYGGEWQGHGLGDGCENPASASAAAGVGLGRCSVPWLLGQSQHLCLRAAPPVMREAHTEADGAVSTTLGASLSPQFGCAGHGESLGGPRRDGALSPRLTQCWES